MANFTSGDRQTRQRVHYGGTPINTYEVADRQGTQRVAYGGTGINTYENGDHQDGQRRAYWGLINTYTIGGFAPQVEVKTSAPQVVSGDDLSGELGGKTKIGKTYIVNVTADWMPLDLPAGRRYCAMASEAIRIGQGSSGGIDETFELAKATYFFFRVERANESPIWLRGTGGPAIVRITDTTTVPS